MAKLAVLDKAGKKVSDIELADSIFAIEPNESAMHLMVVNYLANQRQGTQSTRTRSEYPAAAKSLGGKRAPAVPVRVRPEHRSGLTAASRSVRSLVITALT